jgi:predicted small secreted protein
MDNIQGSELMTKATLCMAVALCASLTLSACDNVGGGGNDFPRIDLGDLEATLAAPATLDSGSAVLYQLAILFHADANQTRFVNGMRRLDDGELRGEQACMLGGRFSLTSEVQDVDSPLFMEDFEVARINARNCQSVEAHGARTTNGVAEFGCGLYDWCDTARYLNFGNGDEPYRNQLVTTSATSMINRRAEVQGRADTGARSFRYHDLAITSSIETINSDETVEQLYASRWGDEETSLAWIGTPSGNNTLIEVNGEFATATNRGQVDGAPGPCLGGRVAVETVTPITRAANGNLNAGVLRLSAGDYEATVTFATTASSAVTIQPAPSVDNEGVETPNDPVVYSRTNFNNERTALVNTCVQNVPVGR